MPFKSQAQRAKFYELVKQGKMSQATLDKWNSETPKGVDLPKRVSKSPASSSKSVMVPKKPKFKSTDDLRAYEKTLNNGDSVWAAKKK